MKKIWNTAIGFSIAGLIAGVYFREFTKYNGFTGKTMLSVAHPHLILLGGFFVILMGLLLEQARHSVDEMPKTWLIYRVGLIWTVGFMLIRGSLQVMGTPLSSGMNAAISGMAGLGHMMLGITFVMILLRLKKWTTVKEF